MKSPSKPFFLFYLLVTYVILQFAWWTWLIIDLNQKLHIVSNTDGAALTKKYLMIGGEALVFFILLLLGMYKVRASFMKERAINRQQKNFLLSVTHELKSPLASVKLQVETLKKHQLQKEKQEEITTNALNDIERLNTLIENVLLAARMDSGNFPLRKEEVDLTEYINECIREFRSLSKNFPVSFNSEGEIYHDVDPLLFRSVIFNLLENAWKYGASAITVNLKETPECIVIRVKDNGPGIEAQDKDEIFKMFYRAGNEDTRKTRGTGLGLHIAKTITEKHNGNISLEGTSPEGSCFQIKLRKKHV